MERSKVKKLWTEKYRPDSLIGYVLRDDNQKKQIETWLNEGTIPHLLFSGAAGVGKCIDGDELVEVEINVDKLSKHQINELSKYEVLTNK